MINDPDTHSLPTNANVSRKLCTDDVDYIAVKRFGQFTSVTKRHSGRGDDIPERPSFLRQRRPWMNGITSAAEGSCRAFFLQRFTELPGPRARQASWRSSVRNSAA